MRPPGPISKSRFLQLGIHAFKMLFVIMKGWGFQLSDKDKMAFLEPCKFSAFFYYKLWFRSPYLANFPRCTSSFITTFMSMSGMSGISFVSVFSS
jgi:hypothetical protein